MDRYLLPLRSLRLGLAFLLSVTAASISAQSVDLARTFSQTSPGGTARGIALGGATTALGADLSTLTTNPAGLGLFTRSEFTITPTFRSINNDHTFLDGAASANRNNFGFGNLGVAIHSEGRGGNITSWTFGIGFNQVQNFYRTSRIEGYNQFNSIGDYLAQVAQNNYYFDNGDLFFEDPYADAAWSAFALDSIELGGPNAPPTFFSSASQGEVLQSVEWRERGRTNQWTIAGAINLDDRFHIGLGIDIIDIQYRNEILYQETDINNITTNTLAGGAGFDQLNYRDVVEHNGVGISATLGLIYQPTDFLRLGSSVKTPGYVSMKTTAVPRFETFFDDGAGYGTDAEIAQDFDYYLTLPWRANFGATFLFDDWGLLTAEAEYTDYRNSGFDQNTTTQEDSPYVEGLFASYNNQIDRENRDAWNFRGGIEIKPTDELYLRGGFAYYGSPYESGDLVYRDLQTYNFQTGRANTRTVDATRKVYSAGLGYRDRNWFVDAAWQLQEQRDARQIYQTPDRGFDTNDFTVKPFERGTNDGGLGAGFAPVIVSSLRRSSFFVTVGLNFGD